MKKLQLVLLISLLSIAGIMAQSSRKSRSIKPVNYTKKVTTIINGKNKSYYSLSEANESVINIQGPGKLRVISRARFIPKQEGKLNYEISYTVDGGKPEFEGYSGIAISKEATYKNTKLGVPAQLQDFYIELGRGSHNVAFKLAGKGVPVAAKYIFIPGKSIKQEWISFSPLQPSEPVDLITKESTVKYYRFSADKPLTVQVNGPTELRLLTRIENHYQMKGRIHYRIQVKEKGIALNTYQLSSIRSEVTTYKNDKELVPGKACEFVINVPKGRHTYEVVPLDKDKNTILGRFLLPKKAVKIKN